MSDGLRTIPEATVARLPIYLRTLMDAAENHETTISSERLAQLGAANHAKGRKALAHPGRPATRGVGSDGVFRAWRIMPTSAPPRHGPAARNRAQTGPTECETDVTPHKETRNDRDWADAHRSQGSVSSTQQDEAGWPTDAWRP